MTSEQTIKNGKFRFEQIFQERARVRTISIEKVSWFDRTTTAGCDLRVTSNGQSYTYPLAYYRLSLNRAGEQTSHLIEQDVEAILTDILQNP